MDKIDRNIYTRIEDFLVYSRDLTLQDALLESNRKFANLNDTEAYISEKDRYWTSVPEEEVTVFMQEIISNMLSRELKEMANIFKEKYGYSLLGEIFVTNKYGANIAMTGKTTNYRQNDEEWWQRAKKKGLYIKDIEYDESAGAYSTDIIIRVDDKDGNFAGVIKVVLNIAEAINIVKEFEVSLKSYNAIRYYLLTKEGNLIYSGRDYKYMENVFGLFPELWKPKIGYTGKYISKDDNQNDILTVYAHSKGYKDYEGLGWIFLMEYKTKDIFNPVSESRNKILIASLAVAMLAVLMGFFISRSIVKPIRKLRDATTEIGKGNMDTQIIFKTKDEIGQLAASFNSMVKNLQDFNHKLVLSNNYTDNIIQSMLDTLIVTNPDATIKTVNQATLNLLGYEENDLIGKSMSIILEIEEELVKKTLIDQLIINGAISNARKTYLSKDGRKIPVLFSASLMRDDSGKIHGIVCMALDISKSEQAEEKLKDTSVELKATQKTSVDIMEDLQAKIAKHKQTEEDLKRLNESLEQRVAKRTSELEKAKSKLQAEINEHKKALSELGKSDEKLYAIIDNSTDIIYLKDIQGRYILVNRQFETIFNTTKEEAIGKTDYDIFSKERADEFVKNDKKTINAKTLLVFEEIIPHSDGWHTYSSIKYPLTTPENIVYGVGGISADITERKQMEEELERATKRQE